LVSSGVPAIDKLLSGGYPEKSAILVEGSSGNEKESIGYEFVRAGAGSDEYCLYVTRLTPSEVIGDAKAQGVEIDKGTHWMCPQGGEKSYAPDDLASISVGIKADLKENSARRLRLVFDLLSQLLISNSSDSVYRFVSQLLTDLKRYDATLMAIVQEDMHQSQTLAGLELLFDGVLLVRRSGDANVEVTVKKMRGSMPVISRAVIPLRTVPMGTPAQSLGEGQKINFCAAHDGARIAYAVTGEGSPLVKTATWLSHLEFDFESPVWKHWIRELSRYNTYIRYDERGCGLSDQNPPEFSYKAWVSDLETVVDSAGIDRFDLLGLSQGGAVAIDYAVRHPERVKHLILYGAFAQGWSIGIGPTISPKELEARKAMESMSKLIEFGWGQDNPVFRQMFTSMFVPEGGLEQQKWFNELQRMSCSPKNAARFYETFMHIDVAELLPQVSVPTLIMHARQDGITPLEAGRLIASRIPGARFVSFDGRNHILLETEPGWQTFLKELRQFTATPGK
jgi:pimeloyl-ACP methyl ester carboxylesterase/KaiC/GvpD/RAD55 family RecA-like ATPase